MKRLATVCLVLTAASLVSAAVVQAQDAVPVEKAVPAEKFEELLEGVGIVDRPVVLPQTQQPGRPAHILVRPTQIIVDHVDGNVELKPFQHTTINLGKYWIGLMCHEASDVLKSHLKIEGGLVVSGAHEGTSAEKAGIQKHDVVAKANGEVLKTVPDLIKAVQAAEGNELNLLVYRQGEQMEVKVTPIERPEEQQNQVVPVPGGNVLEHVFPHQVPAVPMAPPGVLKRGAGVLFLEPGAVLPRPANGVFAITTPLPPGTSVSVTREHGKPAKIHVKRGDKEWNISGSEIHTLPKDLQGPVRSVLGGAHRVTIPGMPIQPGNEIRQNIIRRLESAQPSAPVSKAPAQTATKSEIEELREAIQKLNAKIDSLGKKSDDDSSDDQ
ncbi:MAG: PDZ domain-containing protein [Planctomycetota bacterium]|jgi:membrane-associated protease RseP (regulator of RpoE activity)